MEKTQMVAEPLMGEMKRKVLSDRFYNCDFRCTALYLIN